ncbi:MAG TPA: hypothetical protein VF331_13570 [Polyangiales bacterium]
MSNEYKLYLTYRSEYLVLGDLCVGVRDRRSSAWLPLHAAACAHLLGPVGSPESSPLVAVKVRVGEHLCLRASSRRIVTGPIVAIEEPSVSTLRDAERNWRELFQPADPRHSSLARPAAASAAMPGPRSKA